MSSLTINLDNIPDYVIKAYQENKKTYKKKIGRLLSTETRRSYPNFVISDKTKKSTKSKRITEVIKNMRGTSKSGMSTEEIMSLTRG